MNVLYSVGCLNILVSVSSIYIRNKYCERKVNKKLHVQYVMHYGLSVVTCRRLGVIPIHDPTSSQMSLLAPDSFLSCIFVCSLRRSSSSGRRFIIVYDDGLSSREGEATTPLLAIKVRAQKTYSGVHLTLSLCQPT